MLTDREALNEAIRKQIAKLDERQTLYKTLLDKYSIPISITASICANRKDISEVNDFVAFALISELNGKVRHYFTQDEIDTYSKQQFVVRKIEFPIIFENMIQIAPDQWIGRISTKKLMELKEAQVIKYNENTQRTLQKVVRGENKFYKIALNQKSIREIKETMEDGYYISDDITLNVSPDIMQLNTTRKPSGVCDIVISAPGIMDILDGYHRYIAISRAMRDDPDFDYPMEIRIVSFSEEKAKQFIYQKDQKTKMKKVDSESMNQYGPANTVVMQLNSNPISHLRGKITKTGAINPSFLNAVITSYYFNENRKYEIKEIVTVANEIQTKFNQLTSEDPDWLDHDFTEKDLQVIMFCFANGVSDNGTIRQMIEASDDIDPKQFKLNPNGKVKRKLVNELNNRLTKFREEGG